MRASMLRYESEENVNIKCNLDDVSKGKREKMNKKIFGWEKR